MSTTQTQFKKVEKKYSLDYYWKNPNFYAPTDPLQCLEYLAQHGDWPFSLPDIDLVAQFYQIVTAYQKRRGVWGDQHHTPPAGAIFIAKKATEIYENLVKAQGRIPKHEVRVLDACAGFGMLTSALFHEGFTVEAFERDFGLCRSAERLFEGHPGLISYQCDSMEHYNVSDAFDIIVSNPPFSQNAWLVFLENVRRWSGEGTVMLAVFPEGYAYKTRPAALMHEIDRWDIIDSWPMPCEFAHTKVRCELVHLVKK